VNSTLETKFTTVVKASFTHRHFGGRERAHSGINTAVRRPFDPKRSTGNLGFSRNIEHLDKRGLHQHYDSLEGSRFDYRLIISPHPKLFTTYWFEEDWRMFTETCMWEVGGPWFWPDWVAILQHDPVHPHVRVFFSSDSMLSREDLERLREAGTKDSMRIGDLWEWVSRDTITIEQTRRALEIATQASARAKESGQEKEVSAKDILGDFDWSRTE
jgi:hypothetical protein